MLWIKQNSRRTSEISAHRCFYSKKALTLNNSFLLVLVLNEYFKRGLFRQFVSLSSKFASQKKKEEEACNVVFSTVKVTLLIRLQLIGSNLDVLFNEFICNIVLV